MKKKSLLILGSFLSIVAVMNMGLSKTQKINSNSMQNLLTEAKADSETTTCKRDPGDTCNCNGVIIPDQDEACASWFWG